MNKKFLSSPIILLLPSILAIGFVIIIPLIFSFYTSFTSYKLTRPDSLYNFVGLRNYERLIDNYKFWYAFGRTILFLAIVLNLELLFGLGIALLINKITWGQRTLRTIMMFPMNQNAQDLMMNAPSNVSENQLKELNISIKNKK